MIYSIHVLRERMCIKFYVGPLKRLTLTHTIEFEGSVYTRVELLQRLALAIKNEDCKIVRFATCMYVYPDSTALDVAVCTYVRRVLDIDDVLVDP